MRRESGADLVVVWRAVVDVAVVIVEGEHVDGNLRVDARPGVHQDGAESQLVDEIDIGVRVGDRQVLTDAPDDAGHQLAAVVRFAAAARTRRGGVLARIVRIAQRGRALVEEEA